MIETRPTVGSLAALCDRRPWMDHAACAGAEPTLFFPDNASPQAAARALEICGNCPVRVQCRSYARNAAEPYGIWGGERPAGRARANRRRGGRPSRCLECGSVFTVATGVGWKLCSDKCRGHRHRQQKAASQKRLARQRPPARTDRRLLSEL